MFRKAVRTRVLKKKDDSFSLGALLQETIQKQREEIRNAMMKFPYFHSWPPDKIHQCCVHSNIITYNENEIVRVKDDANVDVTHFILHGKITVVQRLLVSKYKKKCGLKTQTFHKLVKQEETSTKQVPNLEPVYMQVCHLIKGATFGLGEELSKHIILASKQTKCLLIPKHIILQHYSLDNVWQKIILFLNTVYPSEEEIFHQFLLGRRWREYSDDLYKNGAVRPVPTGICLHDIPLTCRIQDVKYAKANKKAASHPLFLIGEKNTHVPFVDAIGASSGKTPTVDVSQ